MRVVALDIGKARVGVAASDPLGTLASPVCVLDARDVLDQGAAWLRVLDDWQPELLVVGLPLSLDGNEGSQARRIRKQGQAIADACGLPVQFVDERLSSTQAKRILHEEGLSEKQMRGRLDMVAASLFLQAWLDQEAV